MIRVKAGIFSFTPPAPEGDDGSYLRWHLLDHMPEQYQLPGIVLAAALDRGRRLSRPPHHRRRGRWATSPTSCNYLVGDPVSGRSPSSWTWAGRLADKGRFPERRPSLALRMLGLLHQQAAPRVLVSDEVVPFRPHRGVMVVVEEPTGARPDRWLQWLRTDHYPSVLEVPGTAGRVDVRLDEGVDAPLRGARRRRVRDGLVSRR